MRTGARLAFLGAPLRSSLATEGTEGAAAVLRNFAVSAASLGGVEAMDGGDIPISPPGTTDYLPGGAIPKNEGRVRESLLSVASRVGESVREGHTPIVFGGDATVLLGLLAGLLDGRTPPPRLGLLAVDGLARFRTTADAPAGDLSTMVIALAVGHGQFSLAHLARERFPLVQETDVILAGVRDATPDEAASLVKSRMTLLPPDRLRGSEGDATFMGVLGRHAQRTREFVLQIDVSVFDSTHFPVAVGSPAAGGLPLERLRTLAGELASWNGDGTIRIVGVSLTGVDARKDPGGVRMHELARFVLRMIGRRGAEQS